MTVQSGLSNHCTDRIKDVNSAMQWVNQDATASSAASLFGHAWIVYGVDYKELSRNNL